MTDELLVAGAHPYTSPNIGTSHTKLCQVSTWPVVVKKLLPSSDSQNLATGMALKAAMFIPEARTWWRQRNRCSQQGLHGATQAVSRLMHSLCSLFTRCTYMRLSTTASH